MKLLRLPPDVFHLHHMGMRCKQSESSFLMRNIYRSVSNICHAEDAYYSSTSAEALSTRQSAKRTSQKSSLFVQQLGIRSLCQQQSREMPFNFRHQKLLKYQINIRCAEG
jgi:hypothetical protein